MILSKKQKLTLSTIVISLIVVLPPILVQPGWLNFRETGGIGDTIGGITAPIVGLVSIALLYLALEAQTKGNKQQSEEQSMSIFLTKITILEEAVKKVKVKIGKRELSGFPVFDTIDKRLSEEDTHYKPEKFIPQLVKIYPVLNMVIETLFLQSDDSENKHHFVIIFNSHLGDFLKSIQNIQYSNAFLDTTTGGDVYKKLRKELNENIIKLNAL